MHLSLATAPPSRLIATLREGEDETTVTAIDGPMAGRALVDAVEAARLTGYGECFWHEPTGQYWWMFKREEARVEAVVLWSRGAVTGWQHVFRATDGIEWLADHVRAELASVSGATPPPARP